MLFCTLQIASRQQVPSGAIGRSRWNVTVEHCNQLFEAGAFLMRPLTDMLSKMHKSLNSRWCTTWLKNYLCVLLEGQFPALTHAHLVHIALHFLAISDSLNLDPTCILLPPKHPSRPDANLTKGLMAALATRFGIQMAQVRPHLDAAEIEDWGKIRRIDSDAGDTMCASIVAPLQDDSRDATYVRVSQLPLWITFVWT